MVARYHQRRWADFGFTSHWPPILASWAGKPWMRQLGRNVRSIRSGAGIRTPMEAVTHYKYALHLPGSYAATYSRTLQFLLWSGTTIFLFDCPYYEFYYEGLAPWVHYVPVNLTNLEDRWEWAQAHQPQAKAIAAAGAAFAARSLTVSAVFGYWRTLLEQYAALQTFAVKVPPDACTCWSTKQRRGKPAHIPRRALRCPKSVCDFE